MRGSRRLDKVRARDWSGAVTFTDPFSTSLTVGAVQAQVYTQTGNATYSLIGTLALTVTDTRPVSSVPSVSAISPNAVALASPPASFAITSTNLATCGLAVPSTNFRRVSTILARIPATAVTGITT